MTDGGFVPGRHLVDAIMDGGFRFAEMTHSGSIILIPTGVFAWSPRSVREISSRSFDKIISQKTAIDFLIIGCGDMPVRLADEILWPLKENGIRIDTMSTAAAARTYNVMVSENRRVAAALICVKISAVPNK